MPDGSVSDDVFAVPEGHKHGFSEWRKDKAGREFRFCCDCGFIECPSMPAIGSTIKTKSVHKHQVALFLVEGLRHHHGFIIPLGRHLQMQTVFKINIPFELMKDEVPQKS